MYGQASRFSSQHNSSLKLPPPELISYLLCCPQSDFHPFFIQGPPVTERHLDRCCRMANPGTGASSAWARACRRRFLQVPPAVCKSATASSRLMATAPAPALHSEAGACPQSSISASVVLVCVLGCKIRMRFAVRRNCSAEKNCCDWRASDEIITAGSRADRSVVGG